MRRSQHASRRIGLRDERGGARLNFLILVIVIGLLGYAGYNYVPVVYHASLYKDYMQDTVNKAAYPPGQTREWVEAQLRARIREYDSIPPDAHIEVANINGQLEAHVQWTRPVQMPGFVYQYKFDHAARSSSFVNPQ